MLTVRTLARFLLLALVVLAAPANASVSTIEAYCLAQIPNNTSGLVSPASVRNCVNYLTENLSTVPYTGQISTSFPIVGNFVNISGTVSATRFIGDGSGLTGITSSASTSWYGLTGVPTAVANVSNGTILSTTIVNGGTASFTTIYGDGSHLSGIAATSVSGSAVIDVRNAPYNVICDGAAHSGNLTGGQAALDAARTQSGTTVILAPPNVVCVYGTNTTLNLETPLQYTSNTNIALYGGFRGNVNNGDLFQLEGLNNALGCTSYQENVNIIGYPGNTFDIVSRTTSQSRKLIGITCTKNYMLSGVYSSTTTNIGSFGMQLRNVENGLVIRNTAKLVPVFPAASGGDAFHIHGNVTGTTVILGNTFYGDDDGCSQTLETVNMNRMTQKGVVFIGNDCRSYRNSALKMGIESSVVSGTIFGTVWEGNHFGLTGPVGLGSDGNCFKIDILGSSTRSQISDTLIANNVFDCPNGEAYGASGVAGAGPFGSIAGTIQQPQGIMNTRFRGNIFSGYQYRGIEMGTGADGISFDGDVATNYTGQRDIVSPSLITSMTYSSANVIRIDFTTGVVSTGSINLISPSTNYYVSITTIGAVGGSNVSNTGRFLITQVSNDFVLGTATNISSSSDQSATTISGSIIFRPGTFFYHRGARNVTVRNMRADDPPAFTNLLTESGAIPANAVYENNQLYNFWDSVGYLDSASLNARFTNNQCVDSGGDKCMTESSSANVSRSTFIMNRDAGVSTTTRGGIILSDADFREKWGNYSPAGSAVTSTVVSCATGGLSLTSSCPTP